MALRRRPLAPSSPLQRYWFPIPGHLGIGVSAYTREHAEQLAASEARDLGWSLDLAGGLENVDLSHLDPKHVLPNLGLPTALGVWFPARNL
jgi:hypothetical protein